MIKLASDHDEKHEHVFWKARQKLVIDPDLGLPILPDWYKKQAFVNDIASMFNNSHPLGGKRNINHLKEQMHFRSGLFVLEEWAEVQRFHALFQKTLLWDKLMEHKKYNLEDKAKYVINFISARTLLENFEYEAYMADVLRKVIKDANNPYSVMCQMVGRGPEPGTAHKHVYFLNKAQEVEELARMLMMKYEPMSRVHEKVIESLVPEDDTTLKQLVDYHDMKRVLKTQLCLPDEVFWRKVAEKDLDKIQDLIIEKKPRKFIMLLDVSGSMEGGREIHAIASTVALLRQTAYAHGINKAVVITFDSKPHAYLEGDINEVIDKLLATPFSGGGTSIDNALKHAETLNPDEIVIVTDGEDCVTYKPKVPVHTVFVGAGNSYDKGLLSISHTFEQVSVSRKKGEH